MLFFVCLFLFFCFSRQGFSVVLVPVLELPLYIRLASNSQRSTCLCLPSVRIKSLHHHRTAKGAILIYSNHTYHRALTFYFVCLFQDRVSLCKQHQLSWNSLCRSGWLKLTEIHQPLPELGHFYELNLDLNPQFEHYNVFKCLPYQTQF